MTMLDAENKIAGMNPGSPASATAGIPALQEQDFSGALLTVGGVADRAMVCRTQRRVRQQALETAERRQRTRHGIGLTILAFSLLLLVLTPVVWSGVQLNAGWQQFADSEMQFVYMIGWLFPLTLAGLILGFLRTRVSGGPRRIDHRVTSRLDSMVR